MRRHPVIWSLIAAYLLLVGLWSAAATPIALVAAGLAVIVAAIPGPALLAIAAIVWLRHRPATKTATA
ncbi:hypothetical protein ACFY2M_19360 [Streptomyces sp. NPDC001276]|uniref:hypothetical protein n=1 Tax=Streptomyces sp. NPDC001276 TaxID=3364555 RepID=UPI0036813332